MRSLRGFQPASNREQPARGQSSRSRSPRSGKRAARPAIVTRSPRKAQLTAPPQLRGWRASSCVCRDFQPSRDQCACGSEPSPVSSTPCCRDPARLHAARGGHPDAGRSAAASPEISVSRTTLGSSVLYTEIHAIAASTVSGAARPCGDVDALALAAAQGRHERAARTSAHAHGSPTGLNVSARRSRGRQLSTRRRVSCALARDRVTIAGRAALYPDRGDRILTIAREPVPSRLLAG